MRIKEIKLRWVSYEKVNECFITLNFEGAVLKKRKRVGHSAEYLPVSLCIFVPRVKRGILVSYF
ncbi:hypothetical protein VAE130_571586 [Vibrio aestuarianus]|nr:hypothetical protein VAE130_571586 [Vibrio aestuarianus]